MDKLNMFLDNVFDELKENQQGNVQNYIKVLGNVNPDLFAVSICDVKGNIISKGDIDHTFSIQSCSKPIMYCIARKKLDKNTIHTHVGVEPSGASFNAHILKDGIPHNPMINAGAIVIAHLIKGTRVNSECIDEVLKYYQKMIGCGKKYGEIMCDMVVYLSENEISDRNKSLAFFMKEQGKAFTADIDDTMLGKILDFYYQNCSVTMNVVNASIICATLANDGVCPIGQTKVFDKSAVKDCQKLMRTCGMYDKSGEFDFEVGLPAKSGVSGCIFLVIPKKFGICIYSPRTDKNGNSIRGVEFCKALVKNSVLDQYKVEDIPKDMIIYRIMELVSKGKIEEVKVVYQEYKTKYGEVDLNVGDYDNRTVLHIAITKGYFDIATFLLEHGANGNMKDIFGNYPIDCHDSIPDEIKILLG